MQGIDGPPGEGGVGLKKKLENLRRGITAVRKQRDHAGDKLVQVAVFVEEQLRDVAHSADSDCQDLAITQQVHHLGDHHAHALGSIRKGNDGLTRRHAADRLFQNDGLGRISFALVIHSAYLSARVTTGNQVGINNAAPTVSMDR